MQCPQVIPTTQQSPSLLQAEAAQARCTELDAEARGLRDAKFGLEAQARCSSAASLEFRHDELEIAVLGCCTCVWKAERLALGVLLQDKIKACLLCRWHLAPSTLARQR